ncbi:TauD/TfdA dioxygenase family protein, partial [Falsiroseomonas oryzae]|uniref:TauD/TfdA dioxygenase family protein n=1 Tax=Falsiroseomonas oryzae TaxID=2766473 RepID=UPI0022EADFFF
VLRPALRDHEVLVLRDQALRPDRQAALAACLAPPAMGRPSPPARAPHVLVGEAEEFDGRWRADLAWSPEPGRVVVAVQDDARDGRVTTEFASQVAAHARLAPWLRDRIEFLDVEHAAPQDGGAGLPGAVHPLVSVDPETGRRALLLGDAAQRVVGLAHADSDDLLHRLQSAATHPAVVLRHGWREGDVVIWDSLAVQHRSTGPAAGRLRRAVLCGPPPPGPREVTMPWVSAG